MGSGGKKGARRKGPPKKSMDRLQILQDLRSSATDLWVQSANPVKKRIGRLEVAWRDGIQWLSEDIQKMYQNFQVVGDAYDRLDINIAAIKAILIEKQVFTEEEFRVKQGFLIGVMDRERMRRQAELKRIQEEADAAALKQAEVDAKAAEAEAAASDGSTVSPELKRMHQAATAAGESDEIEVPVGATVFGG
jgi:hypothetical protein